MSFFKKYDKVISLGCNCYIKVFMASNGVEEETNLFDYIGTSMWGICDLFYDDNSDSLCDIKQFQKMHIFKNSYILTNKKYYIRFQHENYIHQISTNSINTTSFKTLESTLRRRWNRLKNILQNKKSILFIRLEQDNKNRIEYNEYKEKQNKNEIEYVIEFSKNIKRQYPSLKFNILFISKSNNNYYDEANNIVIVNNIYDITSDNCKDKLNEIIKTNDEFISTSLV